MMRGVVKANLDPVLTLRVRNDLGTEIDVEAVVDSGFNDSLSLRASVISRLGLLAFDTMRIRTATGELHTTPLYLVRVIWHGEERIIATQQGEPDALIGMGLMLGSKVTLHVRNGGPVEIEPEA